MWRGFKQDMIACLGEFVGTTMFIFLGLGCVKTAQDTQTASQLQVATTLSNQALIFIAVGMGFSLLITAWVFYRITGGLFNPAVTLALWLIGALKTVRAILLTVAQFLGGIAGAGLVACLTPDGGISSAITKLEPGMSKVRGTFLEAFLTAMLVFTVLMLAAEKHKATYLAPIGIGLTLFVCQLFGTLWTGCGMNPARSLGPSVISHSFPVYHWIYYVGPLIGSLIATGLYSLLKAFDYTSVVLGQDSSDEQASPKLPVTRLWNPGMGFTRQQRTDMLASGMHPADIERAEANMVNDFHQANGYSTDNSPQSRVSDATLINMHPMNGKNGNGTSPAGDNNNSLGLVTNEKPPAARKPRKTRPTDGNVSDGQMATNTPSSPPFNASAMQPGMQDSGAMSAPGTHTSGLTNVPIVKKVIRHTHHDTRK